MKLFRKQQILQTVAQTNVLPPTTTECERTELLRDDLIWVDPDKNEAHLTTLGELELEGNMVAA